MDTQTRRPTLTLGGALLLASEGRFGDLLWSTNIDTLGTRIKDSGGRTYSLDGFVWSDGAERSRFYVLSGGAGTRRTVYGPDGEPIALADTRPEKTGKVNRGLSKEFRAWIANAAAADAEFVR